MTFGGWLQQVGTAAGLFQEQPKGDFLCQFCSW